MKSTSRSPRLVRIPITSAPRSREGPAVVTMLAPSSLAMMAASVVLPSPGGPESSTWSSGSPRRLDRDSQALHRGALPHVLVQALRAELPLHLCLVGQRHAAHDACFVGHG